ncbi:hypothetical protein ACEWY4_008991 [Coilia grayii]|uniref:DDE Tnp4 domain-containing protein n=1 Tax=Coilia grayii TaxID=363190 RepID=A0ABD1K585_9TELE
MTQRPVWVCLFTTYNMADEQTATVNIVASVLQTLTRIRTINESEERELQTSWRAYKRAVLHSRRLYRRKRAAAAISWYATHQLRGRTIWRIDRSSGEVFWSDFLENFDDEQWRHHFRMTRCTFEFIFTLVEPVLTHQTTSFGKPLEPRRRLAVALWWYATPSEYRTISLIFGIGVSTVCFLVREVTTAIKNLAERFICLPKGKQLQETVNGFAARGYPMCAGAIDGLHIPIVAPKDDPTPYCNRKGWHSIVVQAVVDHNFCFTDLSAGWPGSTEDAVVLANSTIFQTVEAQDGCLFPGETVVDVNGVEAPMHLIGDAAYPLKNWLMKEFTNHHPLTPEQETFNSCLNSARIVVENAFGRLKGRWRCLVKRNNVNISVLSDIVTACCILHNICERNMEQYLPEWDVDAPGPHPTVQPDTEVFQAPDAPSAGRIREAIMSML